MISHVLSKNTNLFISQNHALISHNRSQRTSHQFEEKWRRNRRDGDERQSERWRKDWRLVVFLRITRLFIITGHEDSNTST